MSDYDQWRQNQSYRAKRPVDDGGAALFWVLVVVVALGVFVFANFVTGSVRGDFAAPPVAGPEPRPAAVAIEQTQPVDGVSIGGASYTSSD